MTSNQSWGAVVADLMQEHQISQRRLAEVAGTNRSTLRKLMAGYDCIRLTELQKVLSALGYELDAVKVAEPIVPPTPGYTYSPINSSSLSLKRRGKGSKKVLLKLPCMRVVNT